MVAQFLGLKLRLLANIFRRSPWQVVGVVIGLVYGVVAASVLFFVLAGLRSSSDVELIRDILIVAGAATVFGFIVVPLVFGVDDTLDPRRFGLFGIPDRTLALGLAVAACVGIPAIVLAVALLGTVVTWSRGVPDTLFAFLGAVLAFATCILVSRMTAAFAAVLLATRRAREFGGLVALLIVILLSPVAVALATADWGSGRGPLSVLAGVLGWTPLGLPFAIPGDAASGDWGVALLKSVVSIAVLALLWLGWVAVVGRVLVSPGREAAAKAYRGLGWFDRLPHGPTGSIAARSLTYWVRDPRYWTSILMIPFAPVLVLVPLALAGVPAEILWLIPVPLVCLLLGWTLHNDVASDSTAIWVHVASDVRGSSDRLGRIAPVLAVGAVVIGLGSAVTVFVLDDAAMLPSVAGVGAALLLAGLGIGSITAARFPYPTAKPGDSPFAQPQSTGSITAVVQSVTMFASLVVAAPAAWFAWLGMTQDPAWHQAAFAAGLGLGVIALALGVAVGGRAFSTRGPEILAAAQRA